MGSINGKHTQYESEMKKTIAILGSALLLAAFPAQAQQPQSGSAAQDTEQAAPLTSEELMRIAIRLSEEKYCSVAATVRGVAEISYSFEILDD